MPIQVNFGSLPKYYEAYMWAMDLINVYPLVPLLRTSLAELMRQ